MAERLLEVRDLRVQFRTEDGFVRAVDGVDFQLDRAGARDRRRVRLGEERDGDDDARAHPRRQREVRRRGMYKDRDLLELSEDELQAIRGNEIAMIFQDPMTSLNPVYLWVTDRRGDPGPQREHLEEQREGSGRGTAAPGRNPERR